MIVRQDPNLVVLGRVQGYDRAAAHAQKLLHRQGHTPQHHRNLNLNEIDLAHTNTLDAPRPLRSRLGSESAGA